MVETLQAVTLELAGKGESGAEKRADLPVLNHIN
jgi:hypothetical protein